MSRNSVPLLLALVSLFAFTGRTLLLAEPIPDTAASIPGIEISTSVDLAEVYVGDLITYKVTIIHDSTIQLVPPPLGANLGAFDVKDYQPDLETKLPDGRIRSETKFVLSTFTTGKYIIPPLPILFRMPDSAARVMLAEAVPINVLSLLENVSDSADIRPLKSPHEFKRNWKPYILAGVAALVLLVAALLLWLKFRRKKGAVEVVDLRPAWEIAFEKLALLKTSRLIEEGRFKQYYIELTEIVRGYLARMYTITVLDMTTEEFLLQFRDMTLPASLLENTASFLRHADLVKFAKYVPEPERIEADFGAAHDVVEIVRVDFEQRQKMQINRADSPQSEQPVGGGEA